MVTMIVDNAHMIHEWILIEVYLIVSIVILWVIMPQPTFSPYITRQLLMYIYIHIYIHTISNHIISYSIM